MPAHSVDCASGEDDHPLPLADEVWAEIAQELGLSEQQRKIVELILRGHPDKSIAAATGLSTSTIKTYLKRIYLRTNTEDRMKLVLRIFAMAQERSPAEHRSCG